MPARPVGTHGKRPVNGNPAMNGITLYAQLISTDNWHGAIPSHVGRTGILTANTENLRQLLAQCSLGNRRAFETLYRSVAPSLHSVALRCMGRRDLAEEVVQESFVRIWHNASRYEAHLSAPLTWMINITRNLAIDQLRKHRELPLSDLQQNAVADDTPGADEQLDSARSSRALNHCLEQLDGMQRQTITIAYFHGFSASELATQLAAPLGTVKSSIRRGMERLRRSLAS